MKPTISANADHTYRVRHETIPDLLPVLHEVFRTRNFMVQPFLRAVLTEGGFSVFYFNGKFSHAIIKTPQAAISRSRRAWWRHPRGESRRNGALQGTFEETDKVMQALKDLKFGSPMMYG